MDVKMIDYLIAAGTKKDILSFLAWNDKNGVYLDSHCTKEGLPLLTYEIALGYLERIREEL